MELGSLNFENLRSDEALIGTHFRVVAQKPYDLPQNLQSLDLMVELERLTSSVREGQISLEQAIRDFDSLLGLRSSNIRSFDEDFCRGREDLKNAAHHFLNTFAGLIAQSPFSESDDVRQENNGGMLAAARFLSSYAYAVDKNDQTIFIPEGDIFFAFQRAENFWGSSLPGCKDTEAHCIGQKVFSALQGQLKRLTDETLVTIFGENPRDVQYGAAFFVDQLSEARPSLADTSEFSLETQEMGEQLVVPQVLWTDLAERFGERAFVTWKIDCDSQKVLDLPNLEIHHANSWEPSFTSAMVLADATVPLTLMVEDVYGHEKIYHKTVTVKNNINEAPIPEIEVLKKVAAGEVVTAKIKSITDNPDDQTHKISWKVTLGNQTLAQGEGDSIKFTAPNLLTATKLRVTVSADDGHAEHNVGTKTVVVNVSAAQPSTPEEEQQKGALEFADVARVFDTAPVTLEEKNVEQTLPTTLMDLIKLDQKVEYYDLSFLVDSSGSMHEKLTLLTPYIQDIITTLKDQVTEDGLIRISFFTYGDEQTTRMGKSAWVPASALKEKDFETQLTQTIKYVSEHNLDTETVWYTIWDLYAGPHKENWSKSGGKPGEYEHRMVALSDEEIDSPENVTVVPQRSKPFDRAEAEKFVASHPDASLRLISLSATAFFKGKTDVVKYDPADDQKNCPSGMSFIPGRKFVRGGDGSDEGPLSLVALNPYCIDQTEVTNAQYTANVKKSPSREGFDGPKQPVADINWKASKAYCKSQGKTLPTEAQWENVAKGPDGAFEYPTAHGESPSDTNANWSGDTVDSDGTSDVAIYPVGPFGTYDMAGNVWEWTSDNYAGSYDVTQTSNPTGPTDGSNKILRGGSWRTFEGFLRSSDRNFNFPDFTADYVGFRCVSAPRTPKK